MNIDTAKEETLRRYLLDDLTEDERGAVELRFMNDDPLFDQIKAVEDELYLDYSAGELSEKERTVFERKYLRTAEDRQHAAFADALLEITADIADSRVAAPFLGEEKPSFLRSIAAFLGLSGSALQAGMAAAVVLMALGMVFLLIQNGSLRRDVAQLDSEQQRQKQELERVIAEKQSREAELERQVSDERDRAEQDQQRISEIEAERSRLQTEIEDARRRSQQLRVPTPRTPGDSGPSRSVIALVLSPGQFVRGGNNPGASRVVVTPTAKTVRLSLQVKADPAYGSYRVSVANVDDTRPVFTNGNLRPRSGRIAIDLSTVTLPMGDYEVTLSGVTQSGKAEEVTRYYFSVVK